MTSHYRFTRDREILEYLDQGKTSKEVALIVGVSIATVYRAKYANSSVTVCTGCGKIVSREMNKMKN